MNFTLAIFSLSLTLTAFADNLPATLNGGISGYQFDAEGTITNLKSIVYTKPTPTTVSARKPIEGQPGTWLHVVAGELSGFWVMEFWPQAYVNGIIESTSFNPPRKVTLYLLETPVVFTKFDESGKATETRTKDFQKEGKGGSVILKYNRRAVINSRPMVRITGGELEGFWMVVTKRVTE